LGFPIKMAGHSYNSAALRAGFSWWEAWGPWWEAWAAGPCGVFGISERDWLSNYRVLKIEGFGGRLPVGGRPGARGSPALP